MLPINIMGANTHNNTIITTFMMLFSIELIKCYCHFFLYLMLNLFSNVMYHVNCLDEKYTYGNKIQSRLFSDT